MSDVSILGWGQTRFGVLPESSVTQLAAEAIEEAFVSAGIGPGDVDAGWLSLAYPNLTFLEGEVGSFLAELLGGSSLPVTRITNLCAGGMDAIRAGSQAIRSGDARIVIIVGVEKMRDVSARGSVVRRYQEETHPLLARGRTAPGMFALRAARYSYCYGSDDDAFRRVVVKNRENGAKNRRAHLQIPVSLSEVQSSRMAADPLSLLECCPTSDGAVAIVLASPGVGQPRATLRAIGVASDRSFYRTQFDTDNDYLGFAATRAAVHRAFTQANLGPEDVDVIECHDCFSVTEILNIEDLGFCRPGDGWRLVRDGETGVTGTIPVNVSGGLIAGGHPVGATGVRLIVDIARQVSGAAPSGLQVPVARIGLAHALGGPGNVAAVGLVGSA